jgi:hypothetical protein
MLVPLYDVRCPEHGLHEVFRRFHEPFSCEAAPFINERHPEKGRRRCWWPVEQVISACGLPGIRIDCASEDATSDARRADGTAHINIGLPGVETVIGTREDGKPKLAYRPLTHHEVGSNANAREIAKRNGLEMIGEGAYRSVGR